jgi:hypothetical protein
VLRRKAVGRQGALYVDESTYKGCSDDHADDAEKP